MSGVGVEDDAGSMYGQCGWSGLEPIGWRLTLRTAHGWGWEIFGDADVVDDDDDDDDVQ